MLAQALEKIFHHSRLAVVNFFKARRAAGRALMKIISKNQGSDKIIFLLILPAAWYFMAGCAPGKMISYKVIIYYV